MTDLSAPSEREMEVIRNAVIQHEGLLLSVFDVLRRVPRRVLMVLKLNDLTRYVYRNEYSYFRNLLSLAGVWIMPLRQLTRA